MDDSPKSDVSAGGSASPPSAGQPPARRVPDAVYHVRGPSGGDIKFGLSVGDVVALGRGGVLAPFRVTYCKADGSITLRPHGGGQT